MSREETYVKGHVLLRLIEDSGCSQFGRGSRKVVCCGRVASRGRVDSGIDNSTRALARAR